MTSHSSAKRRHTEISDYGFARARDIAFDAIRGLWAQRKAAGWKQSDVAERLGKDTAWLSRQLSGPGNWTLRTLGELCEAMDGELEIVAHRIEVPIHRQANHHAYAGYGDTPIPTNQTAHVVLVRQQPNAGSTHVIEYTR